MIHPKAQTIIERYFQSLDTLKMSGKIKLNAFYEYWEVNKGSMHNTKIGRQEKIHLQLIYALVIDYGISADWLITGRGRMFSKQPARPSLRYQQANSQS
jgi:hypothetical protein